MAKCEVCDKTVDMTFEEDRGLHTFLVCEGCASPRHTQIKSTRTVKNRTSSKFGGLAWK